MQNTDGGRKLNQAMASTGRAVATTSKAVGGAISQAKGAFSHWWSNLLVSPEPIQKAVEVLPDNEPLDRDIVEEDENLSNGNIEEIDTDDNTNKHEPGEVHTV